MGKTDLDFTFTSWKKSLLFKLPIMPPGLVNFSIESYFDEGKSNGAAVVEQHGEMWDRLITNGDSPYHHESMANCDIISSSAAPV